MLQEAEVLQVLFQVACKSFHTCLNQPVVNLVTQKRTEDTTLSLLNKDVLMLLMASNPPNHTNHTLNQMPMPVLHGNQAMVVNHRSSRTLLHHKLAALTLKLIHNL